LWGSGSRVDEVLLRDLRDLWGSKWKSCRRAFVARSARLVRKWKSCRRADQRHSESWPSGEIDLGLLKKFSVAWGECLCVFDSTHFSSRSVLEIMLAFLFRIRWRYLNLLKRNRQCCCWYVSVVVLLGLVNFLLGGRGSLKSPAQCAPKISLLLDTDHFDMEGSKLSRCSIRESLLHFPHYTVHERVKWAHHVVKCEFNTWRGKFLCLSHMLIHFQKNVVLPCDSLLTTLSHKHCLWWDSHEL